MALDRLLPISTTPGAVTGNSYMDAVQEEVTGLWDRSVITLTAVAGTDTITATATPALTASLGGSMNFILKPAATNTTTVTLNVNGGGAVAVVDAEGTALTAGALRINANYLLHYDSGISKFVIVGYVPATNVAVGSKLLATASASAAPSVDFVNGATPTGTGVTGSGTAVLNDTYDHYQFIISSARPATNDVELWLRVGTGGGPTYQTTLYEYVLNHTNTAGAGTVENNGSDVKIIISGRNSASESVGNAASANASAVVDMDNPETAAKMAIYHRGGYTAASANFYTTNGAGLWTPGTAVTAIRFMFESGNITSGRFTLYGATKA